MFLWFLPFSRISKLCGISEGQNSDSPRLHQLYAGKWVSRTYPWPPSADSIGEPGCGTSFRSGRLFFPILRRCVRFERVQEAARNGRYFVDCGQECGFVCFRRLVEAANFSHELERRGSDLVRCDGRIKVEKCFDIPAHSCDLNWVTLRSLI